MKQGLLLSAALLLSGSLVSLGAFAGPAKEPKKVEVVPGQFVVELKQDRALYNQASLERKLGGKIVRQVRPNLVTIQRPNVREDLSATARELKSLAEVQTAEPNYILRLNKAPNDPDFSKLWGMSNSGLSDSEGNQGLNGVDISAEKAWEITKGSKNVIVAVIDTGIDYNHPELKKNVWTNEAEAKGKKGVDDDNNGYVDDIHGYNFVNNTGDPLDDNGHGSHVSGTIGAEPDNGVGIAGVNWDVTIIGVKFLDASGGGALDAAIGAVDYARKSKAKILSNSWGGNIVSELLEKAVGMTRDEGQLFVAAAGNDTENNDTGSSVPSTYKFDNVLSVAAIDNRGELAYFSNYGAKTVHVAAPGVNVLSTFMKGGYETYSGTSMACPHVTGIAALLLANEPSMTYDQLKDRIMKTARPLRALNGKVVTGGLADAYYTLTGLKPPADPNDPSVWTEQVTQSVSSEHPYANSMEKTFTIKVPGAKRISVHFAKFETEKGYDKLDFVGDNGKTFGTVSGTQSGQFGPIIDGDTVVMKFTSDSSQAGYGFDIDAVAVER